MSMTGRQARYACDRIRREISILRRAKQDVMPLVVLEALLDGQEVSLQEQGPPAAKPDPRADPLTGCLPVTAES